jgi:hypothetical protein
MFILAQIREESRNWRLQDKIIAFTAGKIKVKRK